MSLKHLASPLIVIIAGVILTIIVVAAPDSNTGALSRLQPNYLPPTLTALAALASTQDAYPNPTNTTTTATATATTTATLGATSTTPSATVSTPTAAALQPTRPIGPPPLPPTATATDTATDTEVSLAPEETTPTPVNTLVCPPGEAVQIAGQGPPRAAFLLYFGQRAVSGGSVSADGYFSIPLVVGQERPGVYPVTVRVRGTREVLRELTCEVPAPPPPTPIKGRPAS